MATTISKKAIEAIRSGKNKYKVRGALMRHFDLSENAIEAWVKDDRDEPDTRLTTPDAVEIIMEETGLKKYEILIEK